MAGFGFTEAQDMFRREIINFAQRELAPGAKERAKATTYPVALRLKMAQNGLLGINIPEKYGGHPADWVTAGIAVEEVSRADCTSAWYMLMPLIASHALEYGLEEVRQEWLPPLIAGQKVACLGVTEPDCGNDVAGMKTRAVREGDSYVLNGEKTSMSGGMFGDVALIFAKTNPQAGARGVSCFVTPLNLPGISKSLIQDMGWHSLGRAAVTLEDVRLPAKYMVGEEGRGFYIVMRCFDFARALIGLMALGLARASLDDAISYARHRTAFGKPIAQFQAVSFKIAEHMALMEAARLLAYHTLWLKDQGRPHAKEGAMAKMVGSELAVKVIHDCLLLHGNFGYSSEYPLEQRLRDVIACEIMEGTPEIQRLIVAREVMGADFRPG